MPRSLFIKLAGLGDLLMLTPAIRAYKTAFPNEEIIFVIGESNKGILENNPYINRVVFLDDNEVIYPPVDTEQFDSTEKQDNYYLVVGALVPYKRIDIAIKAINALGLPLKIIGTGYEEKRLKRIAQPNIEFLGWQDKKVLGYN